LHNHYVAQLSGPNKYYIAHIRLKAAIAWTIITEVVRNHGGNSDLRIIEMHPGGGQYYIYQIVRVRGADGGIYDPSSVPVGDFNLLSGTVSGCGINSDTSVPWLREWFENPDPKMAVDIAVQTLDLPVVIHLPSTNRRIFGFRLMSALLGSRITKSDYLFPRMGFADTSGYGGGRLKELSLFSSLSPSLENDKNSDSRAADCWLLYSGWEERGGSGKLHSGISGFSV